MPKRCLFLPLFILCTATILPISAQTKGINAADAKNYVGEKATVCGRVVRTRFAEKSKGQPTFLNLDEPYPKQIFTIVVWGSERPKFGKPEEKYSDRRVCVTGKITSFRGTPEIAATDPTQIEIQK